LQNTTSSGATNNGGYGVGVVGTKLGGAFSGAGAGGFARLSGGDYGGAFNNSGIPERLGSTTGSDMSLVSITLNYYNHRSFSDMNLHKEKSWADSGQVRVLI
jgi:hypothetical protein